MVLRHDSFHRPLISVVENVSLRPGKAELEGKERPVYAFSVDTVSNLLHPLHASPPT